MQANWFAAEFLMAMDAARRWAAANLCPLATLEDVVRFAWAFGVSLQNAACIRDEQRCEKLHAEINADEHHGVEPMRAAIESMNGAWFVHTASRRSAGTC